MMGGLSSGAIFIAGRKPNKDGSHSKQQAELKIEKMLKEQERQLDGMLQQQTSLSPLKKKQNFKFNQLEQGFTQAHIDDRDDEEFEFNLSLNNSQRFRGSMRQLDYRQEVERQRNGTSSKTQNYSRFQHNEQDDLIHKASTINFENSKIDPHNNSNLDQDLSRYESGYDVPKKTISRKSYFKAGEEFSLEMDEDVNRESMYKTQGVGDKSITEQNEHLEDLEEMENHKHESSKNLTKSQQIRFEKQNNVIILKKSAVYKYHSKVSFYDKRSLFIFPAQFFIRRACVWLVDWKFFEYFILLIIFSNSLTLAMYDYNDRDSSLYWNQLMDQLDLFFSAVFFAECLLKIIAYGLILHRRAYMRIGWNLIDFAVVITGVLELIGAGSVRLKSLRVLRALRPLRSINAIPELKKIVTALIQSIPNFLNVMVFLVFIFLLFAILGTHQYSGIFYNACRINPKPESSSMWKIDPDTSTRVCSQSGLGIYSCPSYEYCGNPADFGISRETDNIIDNSAINYGITSFDDVASSLITVFQIVTTDGWTPIMLSLMDADIPAIGAFYTVMIVVIGSYFFLNLILAVIIQAFIQIQKSEIDQELMEMDAKLCEDVKELKDVQQGSDEEEGSNRNNTAGDFDNEVERMDWDEMIGSSQRNSRKSKVSSDLVDSKQQFILSMLNDSQNQNLKQSTKITLFNSDKNLKSLNTQKSSKNRKFSMFGESMIKQKTSKEQQSQDPISIEVTNNIDKTGNTIESLIKDLKTSRGIDGGSLQDDQLNQIKLKEGDQVDFSFLKPVLMKRKVVDIFSSIHNQGNQLAAIQDSNQQFKDSFLVENMIIEENYTEEEKQDTWQQKDANSPDLQLELEKQSTQKSLIKSKVTPQTIEIQQQQTPRKDGEVRYNNQEIKNMNNDRSLEDSLKSEEEQKNEKPKGMAFLFQKIAEERVKQGKDFDLNIESNDGERNIIFGKLQKYIDEKKDEMLSKEEYFQDLLEETKSRLAINRQETNPTTLRQIASLKYGLNMRRQMDDLSKHFLRLKLENRVEKHRIYKIAFKIAESNVFAFLISLIIIVNTVLLSLDRYPSDDRLSSNLDFANYFFTSVFIAEMILKQIAYGLKMYFKEPFNTFDSVIVLASIIDLFVSNLQSSQNGGSVTALRAFRLLRVFKLAKSWVQLQNLLRTIWKTLKDVSTFSILLFLFIFVYSLLGMELFGFKAKFNSAGKIDMENGDDPASNFNNFLEAFTTVFVVLTNDGWSTIYYNYYRTVNNNIATVYFISLIIIGQKILLNLFLAILLENFDEDSISQEITKKFEESKQIELTRVEKWLKLAKEKFIDFFNLEDDRRAKKRKQDEDRKRRQSENLKSTEISKTIKLKPSQNEQSELQKSSKLKKFMTMTHIHDDVYLDGKSLYILPMNSKLRRIIFAIVTSAYFDVLIILTIFLSCGQLMYENPLNDPQGYTTLTLQQIDIFATSIFALEATLKILAFGFVLNGRASYLRNLWNVLDFIIIILSLANLTPLVNNLQVIKVARVTRPLRLISRTKGLKVAIKALAQAIPSIANVSLITMLFFLIFGIICTSYFKGKLYFCNISNVDAASNIQINQKWECFNAGGTWQNSYFDFDNILDSIQTMFIVSTTSGWSTVMYACEASTEIDYVMKDGNNIYWSLFFMAFIIISTFMLLNLFVGVVISTFNREKDKIGGNNLLTDNQKEWLDVRLLVINSKPMKLMRPPSNKIRKLCYIIQRNRAFDIFIMVCIMLNTIILCLRWYQQPEDLSFITDIINYIFTAIFALEAIIKIVALDKVYFRDSWNIFDLVVVLGSVGSLFLSFYTTVSLKGATTIIRAFRIARIVRLVKQAQNLRLVFDTFVVTLPALSNVGGLLILLLYLYSVLGVYLFADVKRNSVMTDILNFENFWNAFLTLFVISTGDAWDQIMDAFTNGRSITYQCIPNATYQDYVDNGMQTIGCGNNEAAILFFYSYILFVNLIFLNLFIAIILQGFEDTQKKETRLFNNDSLAKFRQIWAEFDPDATTFIPIAKLKPLLFKLGPPMGFDKSYLNNKSAQDKFIISLDLPTYNNFADFQFLDVLDALSLRLMVHENFVKQEKEKEENNERSDNSPIQSKETLRDGAGQILRQTTREREIEFKEKIQKEINKLQFNEDAQGIEAVQQVANKEKKVIGTKEQNKDNYLSSLHWAAAEVAFNHMRYIVAKRKLMRKIEKMEEEGEDMVLDQNEKLLLQKVQSNQVTNSLVDKGNSISPDGKFSISLESDTQVQLKRILSKNQSQNLQIIDELNSSRALLKQSSRIYQMMRQSSFASRSVSKNFEEELQKLRMQNNPSQIHQDTQQRQSEYDTIQVDRIVQQELLDQDNLREFRSDRNQSIGQESRGPQRGNLPNQTDIALTTNGFRQQRRSNLAIQEGSIGGTEELFNTQENLEEEKSPEPQFIELPSHQQIYSNISGSTFNFSNFRPQHLREALAQQQDNQLSRGSAQVQINPLDVSIPDLDIYRDLLNPNISTSDLFPNLKNKKSRANQFQLRDSQVELSLQQIKLDENSTRQNNDSAQGPQQRQDKQCRIKIEQMDENNIEKRESQQHQDLQADETKASAEQLLFDLNSSSQQLLISTPEAKKHPIVHSESQSLDRVTEDQRLDDKKLEGNKKLGIPLNQQRRISIGVSLLPINKNTIDSQNNRVSRGVSEKDGVSEESKRPSIQTLSTPNHRIKRREKSDISAMINEELSRLVSNPRAQKYLNQIEEADDLKGLDKVRQSLVNDEELMSEIQRMIASNIDEDEFKINPSKDQTIFDSSDRRREEDFILYDDSLNLNDDDI